MASAKRTTKVLRTPRDRTVAYARKQKPSADGGGDDGPEPEGRSEPGEPGDDARESGSVTPQENTVAAATEPPATEPPAGAVEFAAGTTTTAATTAEATATAAELPPRSRTETIKMPAQTSIGAPPPMPAAPPMPAVPKDAAPIASDRPEAPTRMPRPSEIPTGNPEDPAPPPGLVPSGDSRSMRRHSDAHEFALIYRIQTHVISRFGVVGTRGQWRVVEYPTSAAASHAYAKECSRFVSDGFSDYREWGGV